MVKFTLTQIAEEFKVSEKTIIWQLQKDTWTDLKSVGNGALHEISLMPGRLREQCVIPNAKKDLL